ncbi:protein TIC 20-I, chloroplastic-like [Mercurialis annua]|uniref:protein TIC 20-I, chloroplastic-like n=1 Tax=Mercurialis annua TaxID=3986 RepID=UPI00215EB6EA|nr:protein TIC 20-I, chloroplastic-like [Mercurialis annua]
MILNGRTIAAKPRPNGLLSANVPLVSAKPALLNIMNSWTPESKSCLSRVIHCMIYVSDDPNLEFIFDTIGLLFPNLSAASTTLLSGDRGRIWHTVPLLPRQSKSYICPRASKDVPYSYRFPPMTEKPKWWWRTLACLPYLMPLHETWMYAETTYHLHPFLEDFEFLTYPFLGAIGRLPSWFLMAYFFVAYLGVVRRKEWPHFFRFHVVMGMLLEISLQVIGTVSRWMPLAIYWGKVGMHFWTAIAFAYLFTVLESIRCALAGMYADVPFACDAAYIQIPYD